MNKMFFAFSLVYCLFTYAYCENVEIKNDYYCYEFSDDNGLLLRKIINNKVSENKILFDSNNGNEVFSIDLEYPANKRVELTSRDFNVLNVVREQENSSLKTKIMFEAKEKTLGLTGELCLSSNEGPECKWSLSLKSKEQALAYVTMPILRELKLGKSIDNVGYFFPRYVGILNNIPANLGSIYGQYVRIQMMEAFNDRWDGSSGSGVVYIVCPDQTLSRKTFELSKKTPDKAAVDFYDDYGGGFKFYRKFDFNCGLGMAISVSHIELKAFENKVLPEVVVGISNEGRQAGFDCYKQWIKTWYHPARPAGLKKVFLLQGSHLYDINTLEDAKKHIHKGIDAFEDRYQKPFYHGQYAYRQDWGGLAGVKEFTDYIRSQGAQPWAYTNPLYASTISETYKEFGDKARLTIKGEGTIGFGDSTYCIGYPPFRDYYINQCVKLVKELGLDGIYIDCAGWATSEKNYCDNPLHEHESRYYYLNAAKDMYAKISKAVRDVNPNCSITTEGPLVDILFNYVDGTLDYNVRQAFHEPIFYDAPIHFLRFLYPDFKFFEIQPEWLITQEQSLQQMSWCMFNGVGMLGYYLQDCYFQIANDRYFMKVMGTLKENADAFSGSNVEMLLPVLQNGLYANRFSSDDKVIYTFMNVTDYDISGKLLEKNNSEGVHFVDLLGNNPVTTRSNEGKIRIISSVKPKSVTVIAELPSYLKIKRDGINFSVQCDQPGKMELLFEKGYSFEDGYNMARQEIENGRFYNQLELSDYNDNSPLYITLTRDGQLKDKVFLSSVRGMNIARYASVSTSYDNNEVQYLEMKAGGTLFGVNEKLSSRQINDGDYRTKWYQAANDNVSAWVILKWETMQTFNTVKMVAESEGHIMQEYLLESSVDANNWNTIPQCQKQNNNGMASNQRTETFPAVKAKYLRVKAVKGAQFGGGCHINELEVYCNKIDK
ncbi:MAG: discoidin domain-containing protein [Sedimentisphaerales bacterium]